MGKRTVHLTTSAPLGYGVRSEGIVMPTGVLIYRQPDKVTRITRFRRYYRSKHPKPWSEALFVDGSRIVAPSVSSILVSLAQRAEIDVIVEDEEPQRC